MIFFFFRVLPESADVGGVVGRGRGSSGVGGSLAGSVPQTLLEGFILHWVFAVKVRILRQIFCANHSHSMIRILNPKIYVTHVTAKKETKS